MFFCTLLLKPTNLEVRCLIPVTESHIFTNLINDKFGDQHIFCAGQETSRYFFPQNLFVFSLIWPFLLQYDLFYCSVLNNSSHMQSLTAYFYDWLKFGQLDTSCVPDKTGKVAHIADAPKKLFSQKSLFFNYRYIIAVCLAMLQLWFNVPLMVNTIFYPLNQVLNQTGT